MKQPVLAPPPNLRTLHTQPSWHNRAGRVDRSACFTVSAAKLWRWVPLELWQSHVSNTTRALRQQLPPSQARRLSLLRRLDRSATLELDAHSLYQLHRCEMPHQLQGDFRTRKSNAMKPGVGSWGLGGGVKADKPRPTSSANFNCPASEPPSINPNRGVGFCMHKMLGLPATWSIQLTVERYFQHAKLKQHFLVCPVCEAAEQRLGGRTAMNPSNIIRPSRRCSTATNRLKLPGRLPGGRVTKLYLPLCTPQEYTDAKIAYLWLQTHCKPNRPLTPAAALLIDRYAELFPTRSLRCRNCLGLRYGEDKPKSRSPAAAGPRPGGQIFAIPRPALTPLLTEQSLILHNLPIRLARPAPSTIRTQRTSIANHPAATTDLPSTLPAPDPKSEINPLKSHDTLLFDLFKRTPSYKRLQQAQKMLHLSEHEA